MKEAYSKNKKFLGFVENKVEKYLGIPYAKSPVGDLRFKAPQLSSSNQTNKNTLCDEYPSNPYQKDLENISEDCLQLNIWKPETNEDNLPVMVWIYGGSYETGGIGKDGAGFGLTFDGETLAKDTGCIIVSVNYRINVFGFLDLSELSNKFESNLGLKDIVCSLQWLKANIAEFAGDANNITLFGQSAGGP